eukprot:3938589-Rhodomonas_salina.1
MAVVSVRTSGSISASMISWTLGRYAPSCRMSHSSPACRSTPSQSIKCCFAESRNALPFSTIVAAISACDPRVKCL